MPFHKVIIGEVKSNGCLKVFELFAESVGETSQAAHVKPGRTVQPFNITRNYALDEVAGQKDANMVWRVPTPTALPLASAGAYRRSASP